MSALEMPAEITTGRQSEEWDGFHAAAERERESSGLESCEIFSVVCGVCTHMCANSSVYYVDTLTQGFNLPEK